ncbi:MAG: fibronectin type III domain-containing protein, partial [Bdellovibrionales bacterium]|nr:fibronectin type III domain-containing protein [Bdellovibrionales bacterium]
MTGYILSALLLLMMISSGCNNPSGGSVVSRNHTPLLKPPGPFSFSQVRAANGNVTLRWNPSERVSEYKVYQGTSSSAITTLVSSCTGLARICSLTGLNPATTYYYSVDSINAAGKKVISASASALSVGSFDITSSSVSDSIMNLTWSPSAGATSYNVLYGSNPGAYSNT